MMLVLYSNPQQVRINDDTVRLNSQQLASLFGRDIKTIGNNPVRAMIVREPFHYVFSSATDYTDKSGLVKIKKN